MAATTTTSAATTEAGRRLRDMIHVIEKRAPCLRPNLVPKSCKQFLDLAALCSTEAQRKAVQHVLAQQRQGQGGGAGDDEKEGPLLVVVVDVNVESGSCNVGAAKFVSEVEADLYSVETILNLHSRGDNDELRLRLEHFLSINGYGDEGGEAAMADAQELYSLAYAIIVCLSAAPFKATVGSEKMPLPLNPTIDAAAVVEALFVAGSPQLTKKQPSSKAVPATSQPTKQQRKPKTK